MKIGYLRELYPEKRMIINKVPGAEYCLIRGYSHWVNRAIGGMCYYYPFDTYKLDGMHTINMIVKTPLPWVTTFETLIPRKMGSQTCNIHHEKEFRPVFEKYIKRGLDMICRPNCKQIICLSECNMEIQKKLLDYYPEVKDCIVSKMSVLPVPQKVLIPGGKEKVGEIVKFFFVGNDFIRKGGCEILYVFDRVRRKYKNLELILVGDLKCTENWAFKDFQDTGEFIKGAYKIIEDNKDWIHFYTHIPNEQVLELMQGCDVGLLPTWADTYGYSALEMQAAGLPVITTDVRAIPEYNDDDKGWVIRLPKNVCGELALESCQEKDRVRVLLQDRLEQIICHILENPDEVKVKSDSSLLSVRDNNSPELYASLLQKQYDRFYQ